ncbi:MAG: hypothetical protein Q8O67_15140 [Deltaproteobacteria bacterium]|nr:hypothetical protein [Deltaproteobacteria bacterium]
MASRKQPPATKPRVPRGTQAKRAKRTTLTERELAQAMVLALDLSAALLVSRAQGRVGRKADPAHKTLLKAVGGLVARHEKYSEEQRLAAAMWLVDEIESFYWERRRGVVDDDGLKKRLRLLHRHHLAPRVAAPLMTEDEFVGAFAVDVGQPTKVTKTARADDTIKGGEGARRKAVDRVANLFGVKRSTLEGWAKKRRLVQPFSVQPAEDMRVRLALHVLFPDVDTRPLARTLLAEVDALRTSKPPTDAQRRHRMDWHLSWPTAEEIAAYRSTTEPGLRERPSDVRDVVFDMIRRMFTAGGGDKDIRPQDFAYLLYGVESATNGERDEAERMIREAHADSGGPDQRRRSGETITS